jgi:hypothetical protein
MPVEQLDPILSKVDVPAPLSGVHEGLDPALPDGEYSPLLAFDLLNFRVFRGLWETRLGQLLWQTLAGSGAVRFHSNYYAVNGDRIRLAARGDGAAAQLYQLKEGTDVTFQAVSGGSGLGGTAEPYFQIEYLHDRGYLTTRTGNLYRYDPAAATKLVAITQVAAPTVAPTVRPRYYVVLDDWSGIGLSWSQSDTSKFELTDVTATQPSPAGRTAQLNLKTAGCITQTVSEDVTAEPLPSHTIAFFVNQQEAKTDVQFEIGINAPGEFAFPILMPVKDQFYPFFVPVGDIGAINYKRFKCIRVPAAATKIFLSSLLLPGRLEGQYRYIYTHYDSSTGRESPPSAISNGGVPVDVSTVGISGKQETQSAVKKSILLSFTSDSGTDATTDQIRIYRSGGVPELTKSSNGRDLWLRVGTVKDKSTTLSGAHLAGASTITVASGTNIAAGDTVVIDKGVVNKEEYVHIFSDAGGGTFNLGTPGRTFQYGEQLINAHSNGATVQVAFHDNVANEAIDVTQAIDIERDGPPTGVQWVRRLPNGRLVCAGYDSHPTGIRWSNQPTPDRPRDYETFPTNVDPGTRQSPLQGWGAEIGGDTTDERITWYGLFQGRQFAFTKRHLYVIYAQSQEQWSANAIQPVMPVGCLNGHTVAEVRGSLYWVTAGPRVVRWDGQGGPEVISDRVKTRLKAAPSAIYNLWYAAAHPKDDGHRYCLYYTPAGATTNLERLDFNADASEQGVWEPVRYQNSGGTVLGFSVPAVRDGGSDNYELYHASAAGLIYQTETGNTDDGSAIAVSATSKKFALRVVARLTRIWLRLTGVNDSLTVSVTTSGSEYGTVSRSYPLSLAGTGELEIPKRVHRDLRGRYVQVSLSGNVSNRPALREIVVHFITEKLLRHNL